MIYDSPTEQYYDQDYDSSLLTVTPNTPNTLTAVTVVRSDTQIDMTATYEVSMTTTNQIPEGVFNCTLLTF